MRLRQRVVVGPPPGDHRPCTLHPAGEDARPLPPHRPHRRALPAGRYGHPRRGPTGVSPETLTTHDEASAWFAAEQPVLVAALSHAAHAGFHRHTCQLAGALSTFLHQRGRWRDRIATQQTALDAAHRLGDTAEQARAHRRLALASADLGRYDDAHLHLDRALDLCGELGDLVGQAWTHYQRALELFQALGGRHAEASTLAHLGASYLTAGDPDAARAVWQHARDMLDDLDQPAADQVRAQLHHLGQSAAEALLRQTRRGHGGVKPRGW